MLMASVSKPVNRLRFSPWHKPHLRLGSSSLRVVYHPWGAVTILKGSMHVREGDVTSFYFRTGLLLLTFLNRNRINTHHSMICLYLSFLFQMIYARYSQFRDLLRYHLHSSLHCLQPETCFYSFLSRYNYSHYSWFRFLSLSKRFPCCLLGQLDTLFSVYLNNKDGWILVRYIQVQKFWPWVQ